MPDRDFLNINDFIAYPFIEGENLATSGGTPSRKGIADAGFVFGLDSEFEIAAHSVKLHSVEVTATDVIYDFRSTAPGLAGHRFLFGIPAGTPRGCTLYAPVTRIADAVPFIDKGEGFVVTGTLEFVAALGLGLHLFVDPPLVEPALLQSLVDTYVRSISVANDKRECEPDCTRLPTSSSSASANPGDAFVNVLNLIGNVKLKAGYNASVRVIVSDNAIELGAEVLAGKGEPCQDVLIDQNGMRFDDGTECAICGSYINSLNGVVTANGKAQLVGNLGVKVETFPLEHKIVITIDSNESCVAALNEPVNCE